jgi:hypothetical protein
MSAMRIGVLLCLLLAGCGSVPTVPLSKDNLQLELHADTSRYLYTDTLTGTLAFTSKAEWKIRESLPGTTLYRIDFYTDSGTLERTYYPDSLNSAGNWFELDPLATRIDTLRLPLLTLPESLYLYGAYRVIASIEGHPDINSETAITVYT